MTGTGVAAARSDGPAAAVSAGAAGLVAGSLRWLHLLVFLALVGSGAGAAQAVFTVHDLGHVVDVQACVVGHGLSLGDPRAADLVGRTQELGGCLAGYNWGQGVAMLTGAVAAPLVAWLCVIVGGLAVRRRLRRGGTLALDQLDRPQLAAVARRFEYWCDAIGLSGSRRPLLLVARVGRRSGQAYTTSLPFTRAVVVIPVGYAYAPIEHLDLVLLHELAHVRVRDVGWAAATWWAGWLNVPLLAVALAPLLTRPSLLFTWYGPSLWIAVGLSLATLVLRSAVLRRREQAADRSAVAWGASLEALREATGGGDAQSTRGLWLVRAARRLVATHPVAGARAAATLGDVGAWESGFAVAAAASLLAMFTYQCLDVLLMDVFGFSGPDPRLASDLATAVAALVWASALIPLWAGRGSPDSRARWWLRVAGSTLGLVAGYYLQSPGTAVPVAGTFFNGHLLVAVAWSVPMFAGVSLIGAGLAETLGRRGVSPRLPETGAAVLGAAIALTTGMSTLGMLLVEHWLWQSPAADRLNFIGEGQSWLWRWAPIALLAAIGVVAAGGGRAVQDEEPRRLLSRLLPRPTGRLVLAAAVAGGLVAIVMTQLRIQQVASDDSALLLLRQRWWICAAAGWTVSMAVLVGGRSRRADAGGQHVAIAPALLAGSLTAALAGAAQFGRDVIAGRSGHSINNLIGFLQLPAWTVLALVVFSAPAAVLLSDIGQSRFADTIRARLGDIGRSSTGDAGQPRLGDASQAGLDNAETALPHRHRMPPPWTRRSRTLALTTIGAAALAVLVATGLAAPVAGAAGDWDRFRALRTHIDRQPRSILPSAATPTLPPGNGVDPGRQLTPGGTADVLAQARHSLPKDWAAAPDAPDTAKNVRPQACADRQAADEAAEQQRGHLADEKVTVSLPAAALPPLGATLVLRLTSYPSVDSTRAVLGEAADDVMACPQWTESAARTDDGLQHLSTAADPAPNLPYPGYQVRLTSAFTVGSRPGVVGAVQGWLAVGHNVMSAVAVYSYPFHESLTADQIQMLRTFVSAALAIIVNSLQA